MNLITYLLAVNGTSTSLSLGFPVALPLGGLG